MIIRTLKKNTNRHSIAIKRKNSLLNSNNDVIFKSLNDAKDIQNIFDIATVIDDNEIDKVPETDISEQIITMKQYPTVRKPHRHLEPCPSWIVLYWMCKHDIQFFAENFFYIVTKNGRVKIPLRTFQIQALQAFRGEDVTYKLKYYDPDTWDSDKRNEYEVNFKDSKDSVLLCSRQIGKTTIYTVFATHYAIFNDDKKIGILSKDRTLCTDIISRVKLAYSELPVWLQKGVSVWQAGSLGLENGTSIITSGLSDDPFTGFTLNCLIIDEAAKLPKRVWKGLNNSTLPTVTSVDGSTIYVTTAKGEGKFKELWKNALLNVKSKGKRGNTILPIEVPIRDIDLKKERGITYEKFKSDQIKKLGKQGFAQEYDCRFIAIDGTLINGFVLSMLVSSNPLSKDVTNVYEKLSRYAEYIEVYKLPDPSRTYTISLDPNESTIDNVKSKDKDPDGIGIHIIDVTSLKDGYEQVLTVSFPAGAINYLETDFVMFVLASLYNNAWMFIENNIAGKEIAHNIERNFEYENIFYEDKHPGYRLTKGNKQMLCQLLKTLIENKGLIINNSETIEQLKVFMNTGRAFGLEHDDLITALFGNIFWLLMEEDVVSNMFEDENSNFQFVSKHDIIKLLFTINKTGDKTLSDTIAIMSSYDDDYIEEADYEDGYYEEDDFEEDDNNFGICT